MTTPLQVLIVEDSPDDAELMILHLVEEGFEPDWQRVDTEADYQAALEAPPDLILADWALPQFSGLRALELMNQQGLDIPFVIISGRIGEESAVEALHRGAHDYVLKDRPARLGQAVRHALAEKRLEQERRQARAALRASERKLKSIFSAAPVGIGHTKDRVILEANPALLAITGFSRQELVGSDARLLYPTAADYEYVGREKYAQIAEQGVGTVDTRWRRKDGRIIDILLSSTHIDDADPSQGVTFTALDITARKEAETALQNSLAELSAIHENAPIAMMLVDRNRQVQKVNGAAAQFAGRTPREMIGMVGGRALRCLNALDDPQGCGYGPQCADCQVRQAVLDTFDDHDPRDGIEAWLPFPSDGGREERCLQISTAYLELDGEERVLLCARDITKRKRAEEALRASEEKYKFIAEHSADVIYKVSIADEKLTYVSPSVERLLGYTPDEAYSLGLSEVLPPHSYPRQRDAMHETVTSGDPRSQIVELELLHKDGHVVPCEVHATLLYDEQGQPVEFLGAIRDITERQQAAAERERLLEHIRQQARRMQAIVDTVPTGVVLLDAEGRVRQANPVAEEDLVVLAAAEVGDVLTHLGQRPLAQLLTSPPEGLWHEVEAEQRTFEVIARPVEQPLGASAGKGSPPQHWVLVINDVTQEREVRAQLRHQERLATVGQLAAGIAHDFNNLLAAIKLYAQLSLRSPDIPQKLRNRLNVILSETDSAANLVEQILDFSRQAPIDRTPLDLLPLLRDQLKLLQRTLPEHIEIELAAGEQEYIVRADRTRVQQTIVNLALNARDAMPQGGRLRLELRRLSQGQALRCVTCGPVAEGEWVEVTVSDDGTGIPPDVLPRIFEPFFTTRAPLGHGLGLAQVYGIVKQHGGHLNVETEEDVGTTFRLYWPALPSAPPRRQNAPEPPAQGRGQKILVVEDDTTLRAALVDVLQALGYTVLAAGDGREALTLLETRAADVSLVLSDWVMPRMGGSVLAQDIEARFPGTPVLMLTGHALSEAARASAPPAVVGWVQKPVDAEALAAAVARALQGTEQ